MEQGLIKVWEAGKQNIRSKLELMYKDYDEDDRWSSSPSVEYITLLNLFLDELSEQWYESIEVKQIQFGDGYQGRLVFVFEADFEVYVTQVHYGSCSACDTLRSALDDNTSAKQIIDDLVTLTLHLVQRIKKV